MRRTKRLAAWLFSTIVISAMVCSVNVYAFESNQKNEKANTFLVAENYREALSLYENTLAEDPQDFEAGFGRAMCLVRLQRYYLALEQLSVMQGTTEEEMLKISDSVRQIKQTLLTHPNEEVIAYYRGLIGEENSFSAMDVRLMDYPDYPQTEYYRTMLYTEVFSYEFCKQLNPTVLKTLGDYYELVLNEYEWQESFADAYKRNLALRIDDAFAADNLTEASELITKARAFDSTNIKFLLSDGELKFELGNYEEARAAMENILALEPNLQSAYDILMRCYYREKDYEQTIVAAQQLLTIDEDNVYAYAYLYRANQKQKRTDESEIWLSKIEGYTKNAYDKGCALALIGQRESAIAYIAQAVDDDSEAIYYAKHDEDLKQLHINKRFRNLVQEEYVEELEDYYAAFILVVGLLLFILLKLFDYYDIRKRAVSRSMLFLIVVLLGLLQTQEVSAKSFKLREQETADMFAKTTEDNEGNHTAELCCVNELNWMLESIMINERTLTPLVTKDTEEAAKLNQCATVNVQSLSGGGVKGQGSGVIVGYDNEKIMIIGCRHTLYSNSLRVRFGNGDSAMAELVGKAENQDFMVLKVDVSDLFIETKEYIKRVNIDYVANAHLAVGDEVVSNGFVSTKGFIYFEGEITNLRKSFSNFEPYYTNHVPYLLTSTRAQSGTSGGGTFDAYGNFIGLQAGIVLATGERYVVPFDTIVEEYQLITGESLE